MVNRFGEKLKELRTIHHWKQKQVAFQLNIDTPMLCKIEKGERKAKKEQVMHFAKIFGANYNDLLSIWLADQVLEIVQGEGQSAIKAITLAEQEISYRIKFNNLSS